MSLLNRSGVRKLALDLASAKFPPSCRTVKRGGKTEAVVEPKFIRVKPSLYDSLEAVVRGTLKNRIAMMPNKGRTIL